MSLVKRNRRNLERKAGEVRFEPRNEDPSLLELCLTLKSLQYRRTKLPDLLASERNRGLFRTLLARRVLWVSVLWAGPQPAAIHAGVLHGRRFYYWLPVYEPALSQASPGRLLLMELMRWSLESGHEEFDFLLGDEAYKRTYATGARIIEPDGDPPLPMRLWNAARARLMPRVRAHPLLYSFLQNGKRSFLTHAG
ncbi:MAG: GNAT family N-acetyltransferase [Deltaproteobacteria bacterium]|nr:GNAT family N-acetyltransferase [Deltaproteobacteria bacterium]